MVKDSLLSRDEASGHGSDDHARTKRLYEAVLTTTPDLAYVFDRGHRFIYANESLLKMWGRSRDEAMGKTCLELGYEPWHAAMHDREIEKVIATKKPIRGEVPFTGTSGRRIYDYIFTPVLNDDGEVEAVAGTTRDVTEIRQAEDELRHRKEQYETLLQQAPLGVFLVDADLRIREANPIALPALGNFSDGVVGQRLEDILRGQWNEAHAEEVLRTFRHTLETGEPHYTPEQTEYRIDRDVIEYYEWRLDRILLPEGTYGAVCYFRDISSQVLARKSIEESRDAARVSEQRYRTLFSSIDEAFCVIEMAYDEAGRARDYRFLEVNPSFERLTGIENASGRWMREISPNHEQHWFDTYGRIAMTGEPKRFQNRAEQLSRWYDVFAFRVGEPEQRRVAVLFSDITERRQADETRQLLINELNHRVKNMLASVQAIVQNTLRRTSDPAAFVTSFSGRIQALSRAHSLLSSATWHGADLRDLIRDQLLVGTIEEDRLTVWGPSVRLQPQMALHMALMLHELGTNSNKYGALSVPSGRITVRWTVEDHVMQLRWVERGGPPVSAPATRGFGMTLIEQSAKGEGGSARMSVEAEGIAWDIRMPLPDAAAPEPYLPMVSPASRTNSQNLLPTTTSAQKHSSQLAGRRVLVVEDEPLVALDICAVLEEAGAVLVGPAGTVKDALRLIEGTSIDLALLDANLHGEPVNEIAAVLTRANVNFLFVTGYGVESLPNGFGNAGVLTKPFSPAQLIEAASRLVQKPEGVIRLRE
jgi:PAS domain S-box-containing protein